MSVAIVTGSAGLIGSETCQRFHAEGLEIAGVDNDMRARFFGTEASTAPTRKLLEKKLKSYTHADIDIRDFDGVKRLFERYGPAIKVVVHTAAQPSHDWAAREPHTDFTVNAIGTLNLLEATRQCCPDAVSSLPAPTKSMATRRIACRSANSISAGKSIRASVPRGIDETMSIDQTKHSLFGASKVAADILVQEYGRYFGMPTACFRGGCLTGPAHAGTELHGFLSYLMKCTVTGKPYRVFGYGGNKCAITFTAPISSTRSAAFIRAPRVGEVYNLGGSRHSNCSMLEAIDLCEEISGRKPGPTTRTIASATTFGGSATCGNSRSIIPNGNFATESRKFCAKSMTPAPANDPVPPKLTLLSVVIPARDEEGCIASTVEHLHVELKLRGVPHEIIVVDDGSSDKTWEILQSVQQHLPELHP